VIALAMICQICQRSPATIHATERLPAGGFVELHYCRECCDADYFEQLTEAKASPRPKLALRNILVVVAACAIANCLAVWGIRSRPVRQTPERLMRASGSALVMVNTSIGVIAGYVFISAWLQQAIWYKKTGGARTTPTPKEVLWNRELLTLAYCWVAISNVLTRFVARQQSIPEDFRLPLFAMICALVGVACLWLAWNTLFLRCSLYRFWHDWRGASDAERVVKVLGYGWPFGVSVLFRCKLPESRLLHNLNPWLWLPVFLAIVLGCRVIFLICAALATRRRSWAYAE
jgi:hypothetical protein